MIHITTVVLQGRDEAFINPPKACGRARLQAEPSNAPTRILDMLVTTLYNIGNHQAGR